MDVKSAPETMTVARDQSTVIWSRNGGLGVGNGRYRENGNGVLLVTDTRAGCNQ